MTERTENLEPPFARRHVQLTIAVIALGALIWLSISSWNASTPHQHNPLRNGRATGKRSLIQIDVNTAEPRELALLPGVGPVLARRIVENRNRLGPFSTVDELRRVHGIGPKTLDEIRHICIVHTRHQSEPSDPRLASSALEGQANDR